jgi:hypothetical protein
LNNHSFWLSGGTGMLQCKKIALQLRIGTASAHFQQVRPR